MSQSSVTGRVIVIEQEPGWEVSGRAWDEFSARYSIVSVLGTSDNYTADLRVGIVFEPGRAQFYAESGEEPTAYALAMIFRARFGGTMTMPPGMAEALS